MIAVVGYKTWLKLSNTCMFTNIYSWFSQTENDLQLPALSIYSLLVPNMKKTKSGPLLWGFLSNGYRHNP